jgi:hypothetical protein
LRHSEAAAAPAAHFFIAPRRRGPAPREMLDVAVDSELVEGNVGCFSENLLVFQSYHRPVPPVRKSPHSHSFRSPNSAPHPILPIIPILPIAAAPPVRKSPYSTD